MIPKHTLENRFEDNNEEIEITEKTSLRHGYELTGQGSKLEITDCNSRILGVHIHAIAQGHYQPILDAIVHASMGVNLRTGQHGTIVISASELAARNCATIRDTYTREGNEYYKTFSLAQLLKKDEAPQH